MIQSHNVELKLYYIPIFNFPILILFIFKIKRKSFTSAKEIKPDLNLKVNWIKILKKSSKPFFFFIYIEGLLDINVKYLTITYNHIQ